MQVLKKLIISSVLLICFFIGKAQDFTDQIENTLVDAGLENVRVAHISNIYHLSFENNIYRWNVQAMKVVLDTISSIVNPEDQIKITQLRFDIPQITSSLQSGLWKQFRNNKLTAKQLDSAMIISYRTNDSWSKIKKLKPLNRGTSKFDLVIYPQFYVSNVTFDKIYEIQLNIAPALEVSFWKGMLFTGQVIVPIVNDYGETGNLIRPGFIVLSQNFKLANSTFINLSAGNFNYNRYGFNFKINHHFKNERWNIGLNTGYTGLSVFSKSGWEFDELNTLTWSINIGYFLPFYSLRFDINTGRFLRGDYGARFDLTRLFGETAIGFYAMFSTFDNISAGEPNAGFHFSIPIPPRKRWKHRRARVIPPRYFDWEYNAGTEVKYGRYFEIRPNENRNEHYFNPVYVKSELLKK